MKSNILFPATERGFADHGWLKSYHTFSFAQYHNPQKIHFGALRVVNDDSVAPGMGFGAHPHQNMEIITIPLKGVLAHKDSLGSEGNIRAGEIQVMSAGTGITHSEYNGSTDETVEFLQIWIFPDQENVTPRYDQMTYEIPQNNIVPLVSPDKKPNQLWLHQKAWISLAAYDTPTKLTYKMNTPDNGLFLMVLEGCVTLEATTLHKRDAIGIQNRENISIDITENTTFLVIEIPMNI